MDHPGTVSRALFLDVLPTLDMWDALRGVSGAVGFHLYLMAQAPGLPEQMIQASSDAFFAHFLDAWTHDPAAIPADVRRHYLDASAGVDVDHDSADRAAGNRLVMPVTVLQQDWGAALGYHAEGLWSAWAENLRHRTVSCGHFMAEEDPKLIAAEIRALTDR